VSSCSPSSLKLQPLVGIKKVRHPRHRALPCAERQRNTNPRGARLYPLLKDGVLELLSAKLRWSNEPVEIIPQSVHGNLRVEDLGGTIRIRDALHARVRGEYIRIVYPYFSEEPALPDEGGRLGLWVMQQALTELDQDDMRIIDTLRRTFFSPQTTPLHGNEEAVFRENYRSLMTGSI
jgi:hypothetical protein